MKRSKTGLVITGVGAAVTGLGAFLGGSIGAGVAGFGLAHIVLGVLDNFRPSVRK